jgi:hypothetical protein
MGEVVNPPFVLTPNKASITKSVVILLNSLQWDVYQAVRIPNMLYHVLDVILPRFVTVVNHDSVSDEAGGKPKPFPTYRGLVPFQEVRCQVPRPW